MYAITPQHRGLGLATELAAGVASYTRDTLDAPAPIALVVPENERSEHTLLRLGFRSAGLIDQAAFAEPVEKLVLDEGADG